MQPNSEMQKEVERDEGGGGVFGKSMSQVDIPSVFRLLSFLKKNVVIAAKIGKEER